MDTLTLLRAVTLLLEIAAPLMAGAIAGTMFKTFVFPRLLSRLGQWAELANSLASSPANHLANLLFVAVLLGLAVFCHPSNSSEALAWLHAHPGLLPVQPTPFLLQVTFHGASFFCAYNLAAIPMAPSPREDGDRKAPER